MSAGLLLDARMAMATVCLGFAAYCLGATLLLLQALRLPGAEPQRPCADASP